MRIRILSDLHLDKQDFYPTLVDADVVVLAGDVTAGFEGVDWIKHYFPDKEVVYVAGNHECYHQSIPEVYEEFRRLTSGSRIHFLENDFVDLHGVRFFGATLWTDFCLFGDPIEAALEARLFCNDYQCITYKGRIFDPVDAHQIHLRSLSWLKRSFTEFYSGPTVVVTHHGPAKASLAPRFANQLSSAAFLSAHDGLVANSGAALWIHGHVHDCFDYKLGTTRVVANPRGYPGENPGTFRPSLVVELDARRPEQCLRSG